MTNTCVERWLQDTAETIRRDGPQGMSQDYCDMVAANLERIAIHFAPNTISESWNSFGAFDVTPKS